jgi:hypothetical protein
LPSLRLDKRRRKIHRISVEKIIQKLQSN